MSTGVEFAHQADHEQGERQIDDIFPVRISGDVVDEGITARLIYGVKQRVPIEH